MELVAVRRVGVLGRVVVPDAIRARLGMETGTPINIYVDGETVVLKKLCLEDISNSTVAAEAEDVLRSVFQDVTRGAMSEDAFVQALASLAAPEEVNETLS